jgi:hypothetical protein
MTPLRRAAGRLSAWAAVPMPESFTYRSYLRYLVRALPRYGVGPLVIVAYRVATGGVSRAVLYAGWGLSAVAMSLVGFAAVRRDGAHAAAAAAVAGGTAVALYAWLPSAGFDRWLLAFVACGDIVAAAVGAAAAAR